MGQFEGENLKINLDRDAIERSINHNRTIVIDYEAIALYEQVTNFAIVLFGVVTASIIVLEIVDYFNLIGDAPNHFYID